MKVQVIGVGVVGEAQAYLASQLGHEVLGFDLVKSTSPYAKMIKCLERNVDFTFICAPEKEIDGIVEKLVSEDIKGQYVIRSSIPPKTTQRLMDKHGICLCHNPEFLREATPLDDIVHPNFILIGQCCPEHGQLLRSFYSSFSCPILISQPTITETVKITLNSYLATLISFWNEINEFTGSIGIEAKEVARIVRHDPRVSHYGTEFFGVPFGGKCLPKDINQLIQAYLQVGINPELLEAIRDYNSKCCK